MTSPNNASRRSRRPPGLLAPALSVSLCAALAALQAAAPSVAGAASPSRYTIHRTRVAAGVSLLRIFDAKGPNRIRVLRVSATSPATVDVGLAAPVWPAYRTTPAIAEQYHAIGAVNGTFTDKGRPFGPVVEDGHVRTSGTRVGRAIGFRVDRTARWIGRGTLRIRAMPGGGSDRELDRWNAGPPARGEVAAFTSQGGTVSSPPKGACAARLLPESSLGWAFDEAVKRTYRVERAACRAEPMKIGARKGAVVLASRTTGGGATWMKALVEGRRIRLESRVQGFPGVADRAGAHPVLLKSDDVVAPAECGSYFCNRNPRTGIGFDGSGTTFLITVDGRQNGSVGMTLPQFARVFRRLGATWALNLDGGGSTTMVAKLDGSYRVVNHPATDGGRPRRIVSAFLVLPGADPGESWTLADPAGPAGLFEPEPAVPTSATGAGRLWRIFLRDPGSTGGLLAALAAERGAAAFLDDPAVRAAVAMHRIPS